METMKHNWDCETVQLGCYGYYEFTLSVVMSIYSSGEKGHNEILAFKLRFYPESQRSITLQNNRDLNQVVLYLWSKFGDLSLSRWWAMVWTNSKWSKFLFLSSIWPYRLKSVAP